MEICPEDNHRNAILAVKSSSGGHTVNSPVLYLHIPQSLPMAKSGTIQCVRLQSWPQEYWLSLVHTHASCYLHFFWFGWSLCWLLFVQLLLSLAHRFEFFLSLPHNSFIFSLMFSVSVCSIGHVIILSFISPKISWNVKITSLTRFMFNC